MGGNLGECTQSVRASQEPEVEPSFSRPRVEHPFLKAFTGICCCKDVQR